MSNKIKAVLFDLDGTLVDTAPDMVAALNEQLNVHKLPAKPYDEARLYVSQGALALLRYGFKELYTSDNEDSLRQEYLNIYAKLSSTHSRLFPGMEEVLTYIEQQGMPWGIVTNKPQDLAIDLLKKLTLYDRLGTFYGGDTLPKKKPEPDQLIAACQDINIETKHVLYLGDDERDIIAAKAAGMPNGVMNYGYINTQVPPLNWQADYYLDKAIETIDIIKKH